MTNIVSLSGGMDSTAALDRAMGRSPAHEPVIAVSIDYGQRHRRELHAAAAIAGHYGVHHKIVNLTGLLHGSALLHATDVPEGHYAEASMAATVVNGRNLLFASALIALTQPGDTVTLGVHAGDHPIYPDCRPDFIDGLQVCADAYNVTIDAPWVLIGKDAILGQAPDAPYHLTWSCYQGGAKHCGRCGTCVERAEAFHLAGVDDPTTYVDPVFWRTATNA